MRGGNLVPTIMLTLTMSIAIIGANPISTEPAHAQNLPQGFHLLTPEDGDWAGRTTRVTGILNAGGFWTHINVTIGGSTQQADFLASRKWQVNLDLSHMTNGPATITAEAFNLTSSLVETVNVTVDIDKPQIRSTTPSAGHIHVDGSDIADTGTPATIVVGRMVTKAVVSDDTSGIRHVRFCFEGPGLANKHCREDHDAPYRTGFWKDGLGQPLYSGATELEITVFDNALNSRKTTLDVTRVWAG